MWNWLSGCYSLSCFVLYYQLFCLVYTEEIVPYHIAPHIQVFKSLQTRPHHCWRSGPPQHTVVGVQVQRGPQNTTLSGSSAECETCLPTCSVCGLSESWRSITREMGISPRISSLEASLTRSCEVVWSCCLPAFLTQAAQCDTLKTGALVITHYDFQLCCILLMDIWQFLSFLDLLELFLPILPAAEMLVSTYYMPTRTQAST